MTHKMGKSPQNGPSAELISCINHLGNLLKNLPWNLPLDPLQSKSCYNFGLETEHIKEEGVWLVLPWSGPVRAVQALFGLFNRTMCLVKDQSWSKTGQSWFRPRLNTNLGNFVFARSMKSLCVILYLSLRQYCQLSTALVLLQ